MTIEVTSCASAWGIVQALTGSNRASIYRHGRAGNQVSPIRKFLITNLRLLATAGLLWALAARVDLSRAAQIMVLMHGVASFTPLPEVQCDLAGEAGRVDIEPRKSQRCRRPNLYTEPWDVYDLLIDLPQTMEPRFDLNFASARRYNSGAAQAIGGRSALSSAA